jgi:hypothetical protein
MLREILVGILASEPDVEVVERPAEAAAGAGIYGAMVAVGRWNESEVDDRAGALLDQDPGLSAVVALSASGTGGWLITRQGRRALGADLSPPELAEAIRRACRKRSEPGQEAS